MFGSILFLKFIIEDLIVNTLIAVMFMLFTSINISFEVFDKNQDKLVTLKEISDYKSIIIIIVLLLTLIDCIKYFILLSNFLN
jgi:hypothetical protein